MTRRRGRPAPPALAAFAVACVVALVVAGVVAGVMALVPGSTRETAAAAARPSPHVLPFAGRLGTPRERARRTPAPVPPHVDGCDHAYGSPDQCVPWTFPERGGADRCGWLERHGLRPLPVHGRDRHRLDPNGDRIACGPGDTR
ncbi:hypothetical protein ACIBH1_27385 [Nonomuraea sp. NPDC050663]|uniref:hypothetical protein n=1 Tax=Nonomuraea sp. NPDC050663 TaxID=3364370 RepID=UPI00379057AB